MPVDISVALLSETRPSDTKNAGFALFRCANRILDSSATGVKNVPDQGQSDANKAHFFFERLV